MHSRNKKKLAILIGVTIALLTPYIIFLCRDPVLIVTDMAFIPLYGMDRLRAESREAALKLFRPVKTVSIVDDAGDDIVPNAIMETSIRPHCVIFPLRFARSARMYREINHSVPIIILEGRYGEDSNPAESLLGGNSAEADYFIYKTDINTDFYRAGLAALSVNMKNTEIDPLEASRAKGRIVVFLETGIRRTAREAFNLAINTADPPPDVSFFTAFSQYSANPNHTCIVMTGTGVSFFEAQSEIPVIFFTWIDPFLIPDSVVLIFNDSPLAQVIPAVKMAKEGVARGVIPSKIIIKNNKIIDRKSLHKPL